MGEFGELLGDLIDSSWSYYDYLKATNKGRDERKIAKITLSLSGLDLHLSAPLLSAENLILSCAEREWELFEQGDLAVFSYNDKLRLLCLSGERELLEKIYENFLQNKDSVRLFVDLKFLVENIALFYENMPVLNPPQSPKFGEELAFLANEIESSSEISMPFLSLSAFQSNYGDLRIKSEDDNKEPYFALQNECVKSDSMSLHNEQKEALCGIFKNSFCYIWGAPGTGKTRAVLLLALSFYIKKGARVAILAPTNTALEQSLNTLLERLGELGIDTSCILRLGAPSAAFLERFANNCDPILVPNARESYKKRLAQSSVIAATLDTFLRRSELRELEFAHFFVDEAANAALPKVAALLNGTPLSLLGDHKQLPPVCVLDEKEKSPQWQKAALWRYSALFLPNFLNEKNIDLFLKKYANDNADFALYNAAQKTSGFRAQNNKSKITLPIFSLTHTYRYGSNLAQILDNFIYKNGLRSNCASTRLLRIQAPFINAPQNEKNVNLNEAKICAALGDFYSKNGKDFAIISPFVNQYRAIRDELFLLKNFTAKDQVFTIHRSQGQEFDSVIFSPVALHYYLTDSRNNSALFALNVALSRARREIIFISDYFYWSKFKEQFISQILSICEEVKFN